MIEFFFESAKTNEPENGIWWIYTGIQQALKIEFISFIYILDQIYKYKKLLGENNSWG